MVASAIGFFGAQHDGVQFDSDAWNSYYEGRSNPIVGGVSRRPAQNPAPRRPHPSPHRARFLLSLEQACRLPRRPLPPAHELRFPLGSEASRSRARWRCTPCQAFLTKT